MNNKNEKELGIQYQLRMRKLQGFGPKCQSLEYKLHQLKQQYRTN